MISRRLTELSANTCYHHQSHTFRVVKVERQAPGANLQAQEQILVRGALEIRLLGRSRWLSDTEARGVSQHFLAHFVSPLTHFPAFEQAHQKEVPQCIQVLLVPVTQVTFRHPAANEERLCEEQENPTASAQ